MKITDSLTSIPASPTSPRQRIVGAARNHFFARGLRAVTMDELAEELGMSKKTLYANFPSKSELVRAVLVEKFRAADADFEKISSVASADFPRALHALLAAVQKHTEEIQPPFLRDIRREAPEVFELVEERRRKTIRRHFGRLLAAGRKAGLIRKDIPARLVMEILLGAVRSVANPARLIDLGLTPKACIAAIITVILEGVLAREAKGKP